MRFILLSDVHMRFGWFEEQGTVLAALLDDISDVIQLDDYLVLSGDIVQAGEDPALYDAFENAVLKKLYGLGLSPSRSVIVPGNHDVNGAYVRDHMHVLEGIPLVQIDELRVNEFCNSRIGSDSILKRLENYAAFELSAAKYTTMSGSVGGTGYILPDGIGIYCLNSAVSSFGGQKSVSGLKIADAGLLFIDTRTLRRWIQETDVRQRILVTHHPLEMLAPWAAAELETIIQKHFRLVVSGHVHRTKWGRQASAAGDAVYLSTPPLFTRKGETLGYSVVQVEADGLVTVSYRQWVREAEKFVTGTALSQTDSGSVTFSGGAIAAIDPKAVANISTADQAEISKRLARSFEESLRCYPQLRGEWVLPKLSRSPQGALSGDESVPISADDVAMISGTIVLKAPHQFGLTTMGRYIALKRYQAGTRGIPLYIDSRDTPNHEQAVREYCLQRLATDFGSRSELGCIIIDNWDHSNPLKIRQLNAVGAIWPNMPIFVLSAVDSADALGTQLSVNCKNKYDEYFLWALDRPQIWQLVTKYVQRGSALDVDQAVTRVADHLESLNLHRTPLNILILLIIFEHLVDYSPVNRTELIDGILQVTLAHLQKVPRFNTIPDAKDTKFALGYFAKLLVLEARYVFTKVELLNSMQEYVRMKRVDFDIDLLIGCLEESGILLSSRDGKMAFRFTYWIYYFAAFQMHVDTTFYNHMVAGRRYSAYYEMIEFFCGIDRRGDKMIETILSDLTQLNNEFEARTELSPWDYFEHLPWEVSPEFLESAREAVKVDAEKSNLPAPVKHAIADIWYDASRPYKQELRTLLDDSSLANCRLVLIAGARALRNCDHGDVVLRTKLLSQVMRTWGYVFKVLSMLAPALADKGVVYYEGWGAHLGQSFDPVVKEDRLSVLVSVLPSNIARFFRSDLYSPKTAPLLYEHQNGAEGSFERFVMVCMWIHEKPRGWETQVQKEIETWGRGSFYLWAVMTEMSHVYETGFNKVEDVVSLRKLVGLAAARHETRAKTFDKRAIEMQATRILGSPKEQEHSAEI